MNPVETEQSGASDYHQNTRAHAFQPQPQGSFGYGYANSENGNRSYGPSFSSLGSSMDQSTMQRSQNSKLPGFTDSSRSHSVQLAPLSALTANLPPSNSTQGTYASYPSSYQISRGESKYSGSDQQHQSGRGREGYGSLASAMAPPILQSTSNMEWKAPISKSSSPSTTSSTKSTSTSPQPNWGGILSPQRSSEHVNGRSYSVAMDYMFPNDDVGLSQHKIQTSTRTGG